MKITVIDTVIVDLVTGECFSDVGIEVTSLDTNHKKIAKRL